MRRHSQRQQRFRTQFCFITPTGLLDRYASASRTHLVLAHVNEPAYVEFYRRKRKEGDLIILDNGAYEDVADWAMFENALEVYQPQVAVLPDLLLSDSQDSYLVSEQFYSDHKERWPEVKWMYVPQGRPGQVTEFRLYLARALKRLKVEWVGLPRAMVTDIWDDTPLRRYARVDLCEELVMSNIKVHALGMAAGDVEELEGLFWEGCASVDSSAPVWRGLHGYRLDSEADQREWRTKGTAVDFTWSSPNIDHEHVVHNMNLVLKALGQEEVR